MSMFEDPLMLRAPEGSGGLEKLSFPAASTDSAEIDYHALKVAPNLTLRGNTHGNELRWGKISFYQSPKIPNAILEQRIDPSLVDKEIEKFEAVRIRLEARYQKERGTEGIIGRPGAEMLIASLGTMVHDPAVAESVLKLIRTENFSAAAACARVLNDFSLKLGQADSEYLRERVTDLDSLAVEFVELLDPNSKLQHMLPEMNMVLVCDDISHTEVARLDGSDRNLAGVMRGPKVGENSHAQIRCGERIPHMIELKMVDGTRVDIRELVSAGDLVLIDAAESQIVLRPDDVSLQRFKERVELRKIQLKPVPISTCNPRTADYEPVSILGAVSDIGSIDELYTVGIGTIGLVRSEFLFSTADQFLDEDSQLEAYLQIARRFPQHPVVIRAFDFSGDKPPPPALVRALAEEVRNVGGLRVMLEAPDFYQPQIRALLRASAEMSNIEILFPMVNDAEEFQDAVKLVRSLQEQLKRERVPSNPKMKIGAMLETPVSVSAARKIAEVADTINIGSNDLVPHMLATPRGTSLFRHHHAPHHPGVVGAVRDIVDNVLEASPGKSINLCGTAAADVFLLPLWIGAGIRRFVVSTVSEGNKLNARLQQLNASRCVELVADIVDNTSGARGSLERLVQFNRQFQQL